MQMLCVASMVPRKGQDMLFDALERLAASRLAARLRRQPRPQLVVCGRPGAARNDHPHSAIASR